MKTLSSLFTLFLFTVSFAQSYPDDCLDSLKIPSSFTPNGDAINDFIAIDFPCPPESFEIKFFNRWGEIVFESDKHDFAWDGTKDKQVLPMGTYVWSMTYTFNDKEVKRTGNITIIR
jgi:gliding motility-associated-like protein